MHGFVMVSHGDFRTCFAAFSRADNVLWFNATALHAPASGSGSTASARGRRPLVGGRNVCEGRRVWWTLLHSDRPTRGFVALFDRSRHGVVCWYGSSCLSELIEGRPSPSNLSLWPLRPVRSARSVTAFGEVDHYDDHRCLATRRRGIHHGCAVVSRWLSVTFSALTCWFLDLVGWISVAGFASRSST